METGVTGLVKRSPLITYFIVTFAISWTVYGLLIASFNGLVNVPMWLHYLGSFGPGLAGMIVAYAAGGREGLSRLLASVVKWRVGWKWLLIGALSPLAIAAVAILITYLIEGTWPDLQLLGKVEYLGDIGVVPALLLWLATFGFGEETGWRGFAVPTMQKKRSLLATALIIGVIWATWHVPSFFYKPQLTELGAAGFIPFALGVLSGSILLTWMYTRSGGSVFLVAIWHGVFDFLITNEAGQGTIAAAMSTIVMVWAVAIVAVELWQQYRAHHPRPTVGPAPQAG